MRLVKVDAAELYRVLSQAFLFAGKDDTLPMLTTVKLSVDGGRLWAMSTDRFGVGVADCAVEYEGDPFAVLIHSRKAQEIARQAKPGAREKGRVVDLLFNEGGVNASVTSGIGGSLESSCTAAYLDYAFPNLAQIFEGLDTTGMVETAVPLSLSGVYVERIGKAVKLGGSKGSNGQRSCWYTVAEGRCVVVRAPGLSVLQMPIRLGGSEPTEKGSIADGVLSACRVPLVQPA